jgi:hypothetical protein
MAAVALAMRDLGGFTRRSLAAAVATLEAHGDPRPALTKRGLTP